MGQARSERKKIAAAANWAKIKNPGRKRKPLSDFPCTCGRGAALDGIQPPVRAVWSFIDAVRQMPRAFRQFRPPEEMDYDGSSVKLPRFPV